MRRNESTQGGNKDEVIMKHTKNNDIYEFKREKISSEIIRGIITICDEVLQTGTLIFHFYII